MLMEQDVSGCLIFWIQALINAIQNLLLTETVNPKMASFSPGWMNHDEGS